MRCSLCLHLRGGDDASVSGFSECKCVLMMGSGGFAVSDAVMVAMEVAGSKQRRHCWREMEFHGDKKVAPWWWRDGEAARGAPAMGRMMRLWISMEKASRFDEGGELASGLAMAAASRRHGPAKVVQHGCGWCGSGNLRERGSWPVLRTVTAAHGDQRQLWMCGGGDDGTTVAARVRLGS
ncbi:hypothetical protein LR48_Vigan10g074900 [Vigna angularis]|uniref:Uncharacterized protein n=1 Tax=Phaseolus angularis TaxID=3914 RepID=A0A0L9VIW6_PHAAN|nr:hypothetical protein LR48_Vigan10g074900 [Vigna angularis]